MIFGAWRVALEARGLGSVSINVRITAVRKLAAEAADNGLLAPELAAGIARVKSAKSMGVRTGNWLSLKQAQALLNTPDITTMKGLRDRAIIAVLLGCGLRRSEVAALTIGHIQQRDGRWCIVDLFGKHGHVRTVPMPAWVKVAIDAWTSPAGVVDGHVFRPVTRPACGPTVRRCSLRGTSCGCRDRNVQRGRTSSATAGCPVNSCSVTPNTIRRHYAKWTPELQARQDRVIRMIPGTNLAQTEKEVARC